MAKDILLNNPVVNGDWNVGYSDEQHIEHVLMAAPGEFKNAPLIGVGIKQYLHSPFGSKQVSELEKAIRLNLTADGAKNISISIDQETKTIKANGVY